MADSMQHLSLSLAFVAAELNHIAHCSDALDAPLLSLFIRSSARMRYTERHIPKLALSE
jgi:hypothetical protein